MSDSRAAPPFNLTGRGDHRKPRRWLELERFGNHRQSIEPQAVEVDVAEMKLRPRSAVWAGKAERVDDALERETSKLDL